MEVSTEISQKIRSAIKAKLMELGAYVDDELPDYIMVMVANKKSRAQMSGDLALFLGTNTDAFTEWLHGLLGKLQTITVESGEKGKIKGGKDRKKDKKDGSKEKKKLKKRSSDSTSKRKSSIDKNEQNQMSESLSGSLVESVTQSSVLKEDSSVTKDHSHGYDVSATTTISPDVDPEMDDQKNIQEDVEDVRQLLVTGTQADELAEELETTEAEVERSKALTSGRNKTAYAKEKELVTRLVSHSSSSTKSKSRSPSPEKLDAGSRKRKIPISVVASVSRKCDNEEEYDPYNPAVGSVASVVKVTARKSSVPASLQANRALLMKAMSDAEKSIAVKRKIAVTRPISRGDSPAEVYSPKRKKSDPTRDEESPPPYFPSRKEASSRRSSSQHFEQRTLSRNDARHTLSRDDRRELISRSRREELLRTIGIDRSKSHKSDASKSPEKNREHSDKNAQYERRVRSDRNVGEVKNFHITTRVVSPQSKKTVVVNQSSNPAVEQRCSVTSRLGKVVVERKTTPESGDDGEDRKPKDAQSSKIRTDHRDARHDIKSRAAHLKSEHTVPKKSSARVISRLGKEAVQKQCEAAVMSVNSSRVVDKAKSNASPDSRVVCCDESGSGDEEEDLVKDRNITIGHESSDGRHHKVEDDEPEDLAEMIADDLEPELLDSREEFTLDLEDEDDITNVVGDLDAEEMEEESVAPEKADEGKQGTRFIVTLDGVDERQFDPTDAVLYDKLGQPLSELASGSLPLQNLEQNEKLYLDLLAQTRPLPQSPLQQTIHPLTRGIIANKLQPPKIQTFSINLKDSDDEHEDKEMKPFTVKDTSYDQPMATGEEELEISAIKKVKMTERCKFWPACAVGSACEYHHPTTHCKTFPNCKFGDKCLFIHPNCRFDSKCTRPDCPFTHTSRRTNIGNTPHVIAIPQSRLIFTQAPLPPHYASYGAPSFASSQTTCRFYPNCYNVNCTFLHPKPCRFGVACTSQGCPFYHPPPPEKNKLKWQAQLGLPKTSLPDTTKVESAASKLSPSNSTAVSSTSQ